MKKGKKIFLGILGGILAVGVIVWLIWFIQYINLPKMEISETLLGLEWGMSKEEAKAIMDKHPEYSFYQEDNLLRYRVSDYQGIKGLSGQLVLWFYEDELVKIIYGFESVTTGGMSTSSAIDLANKSSKKYLSKEFESPHIITDIIFTLFGVTGETDDWIGEKTLVSTMYRESSKLMLLYEPIEGNEEYVDMLQDPVTFMKESEN